MEEQRNTPLSYMDVIAIELPNLHGALHATFEGADSMNSRERIHGVRRLLSTHKVLRSARKEVSRQRSPASDISAALKLQQYLIGKYGEESDSERRNAIVNDIYKLSQLMQQKHRQALDEGSPREHSEKYQRKKEQKGFRIEPNAYESKLSSHESEAREQERDSCTAPVITATDDDLGNDHGSQNDSANTSNFDGFDRLVHKILDESADKTSFVLHDTSIQDSLLPSPIKPAYDDKHHDADYDSSCKVGTPTVSEIIEKDEIFMMLKSVDDWEGVQAYMRYENESNNTNTEQRMPEEHSVTKVSSVAHGEQVLRRNASKPPMPQFSTCWEDVSPARRSINCSSNTISALTVESNEKRPSLVQRLAVESQRPLVIRASESGPNRARSPDLSRKADTGKVLSKAGDTQKEKDSHSKPPALSYGPASDESIFRPKICTASMSSPQLNAQVPPAAKMNTPVKVIRGNPTALRTPQSVTEVPGTAEKAPASGENDKHSRVCARSPMSYYSDTLMASPAGWGNAKKSRGPPTPPPNKVDLTKSISLGVQSRGNRSMQQSKSKVMT